MTHGHRIRSGSKPSRSGARRSLLAVGFVVCLLVTGCGGGSVGEPTPDPPSSPAAVEADLRDTPSPDGGTVKELAIGNPQTTVVVRCSRGGFEPFLFEDQGTWVGCELQTGPTPGDPSPLAEPELTMEDPPVLTVPGPAHGVLISCPGDDLPALTAAEPVLLSCQG